MNGLMQRARACGLVVVLAVIGGTAMAAEGVAQLRQFVATVRAAEGSFEQTVSAASGGRPQQSAGRFAFARPGRFSWEYQQPYPQLLVGDGVRLWVWDRDLNQVTVRQMGDALGATPAAILFGNGDLEQRFTLADAGSSEGLNWVEARPRQADSGFEALRIGLADGRIRRMEMRDAFGQRTMLVFTRLQANPVLDPQRFHFTPPPGADVIGETVGAAVR